jgi:ABC-type transport system involved in multi-copper enzyme maturation permease subunit
MLWYKAWIDTRWRFFIGLGLAICVVLGNAFAYSSVDGFVVALAAGPPGPLTDKIDSLAQLSSNFRGFIWSQVISQNLCGFWLIFAALLGADGLLSRRKGAIFTLALPVSRRRLFSVRAATDLAELFLLALIPMLLIPLSARAVGQTYGIADALVYGISIFLGGVVFYALARLLAVFFNDRWRSITITLALALLVELCKAFIPIPGPLNPGGLMDGESYFRTGTPAWAGLFIWVGLSMALLYAAARSTEKRDF